MQKFGFVGAIAIPTNYIEFPGNGTFLGYSVTKADFVTWDQIHSLEKQGWEITSHTKSHHCDTSYYVPAVLKDEFLGSKQVLEAKGFVIRQFVMPCGVWKSHVPFLSKAAENYYRSYRSLEPDVNLQPVQDPYALKSYFVTNQTQLSEVASWIEKAKQQKAWLIITFHIIDNSHQKYAVTPDFFEKILQLVKQSNIPVVLPTKALGQ
jgi:hypothetical protein